MIEETKLEPEYVASVGTRRSIAITSLLFTWSVITYILIYGDSFNSLHSSALAWAFATNILVMFAYAFGTVLTKYISR